MHEDPHEDPNDHVYSFAFNETLERLYSLLLLVPDVLREIHGELRDWLKRVWEEFDLSWIHDVEERARQLANEDLNLYPAA
jgi:hypothetical protein